MELWQHSAGPPSSVASQTGTGFFGGLSAPSTHAHEAGAPTASHARGWLDDAEEDEDEEQAEIEMAAQHAKARNARAARCMTVLS